MKDESGGPSRPRSDPWTVIRRWFDRLLLHVQGVPLVEPALRGLRFLLAGLGRKIIPARAWRRQEILQLKAVMADAPVVSNSSGPKVLIMSFRAWTTHVAWEVVIAQALRLRGANVEFFFCGGGLPICEIGWPSQENYRPCKFCGYYVKEMIEGARFPHTSLDDLISVEERSSLTESIRSSSNSSRVAQELTGFPLREFIEKSRIWFFRSSFLPDNSEVQAATLDFLTGAATMAMAAKRLVEQMSPDVIVMVNGQFFEERIVREVAAAEGVRVVTYETSPQRGGLFFSDGEPATEYDVGELLEERAWRQLSEEENRRLDSVLSRRRTGSDTQGYFTQVFGEISAGDGGKLFALFTNVTWDTAVTGREWAFGSVFEWVAATIRIAADLPKTTFVIRIHPAESRLPGRETREPLKLLIESEFPVLPDNVVVIPPEDPIDSYALIDKADAVGVFTSTIGLEAAAFGKAVCVVGRTHYRGKGFTTDVEDPTEYVSLLGDLAWATPDERKTQRARIYAHTFFCQATLPFKAVQEIHPSEPVFAFSSTQELAAGRDPVLDTICRGILEGGQFRIDPEFV